MDSFERQIIESILKIISSNSANNIMTRQIIESIYTIRKNYKRPDIESILKIISSNSANNITTRQIIESIYTIRKNCKRPDIESILKIISSNSANNITIRDVEEKINLLLSDKKIENRQKRGLDSLFTFDDSPDTESQFIDGSVVVQDSAIDSNVTVNISVETPK